jgi:hypothetical protein
MRYLVILVVLAVAIGGCIHEGADRAAVEPAPGTITVSLERVEGFKGLAVDAWVLPLEPTEEGQALGGTYWWPIGEDPFSASKVMRSLDHNQIATFGPGTYRFIIEAYVPSGAMHYGCEQQIRIVEDQPLVVTLSGMPIYTGGGFHWTPYDQLVYPDCLD